MKGLYVIDNVRSECNTGYMGMRGGVELPDTAQGVAECLYHGNETPPRVPILHD